MFDWLRKRLLRWKLNRRLKRRYGMGFKELTERYHKVAIAAAATRQDQEAKA